MSSIVIDGSKCDLCGVCMETCPFGAIDRVQGNIEINAACRMCKLCIKKCTKSAIAIEQSPVIKVDKEQWQGILIYAEIFEGEIHPVTIELIGKARQLTQGTSHEILCLIVGHGIEKAAHGLLKYGVSHVFAYDNLKLQNFRADAYANAFADCINRARPSVVLVGATPTGRSLAPCVATRCRTGLTADCTMLKLKENSDLVQIRPAFGGNIMAQIVTPNHRPQFATVRYKVMEAAQPVENPNGRVEMCILADGLLDTGTHVLKAVRKERKLDISEVEIIVVAGRGVKKAGDLALLEQLAAGLGGQLAVTRPLVEAGWAAYTRQIGLSGRTVKPKLIITCGVSGAVQFTAAMNSAEYIFAINIDKNAPIFKLAHFGMVGDLYKIVPQLTDMIKGGRIQ